MMIDLPSLQSLYFGCGKGSQRKDFSVGNLPALTTLEFEKTSFPKVEKLNLTSTHLFSNVSQIFLFLPILLGASLDSPHSLWIVRTNWCIDCRCSFQ